MSEKPIEKLESQLEQLIEGAFARLFRRTLNARDVAVMIARGMEDHLQESQDDDPRHIAPDLYFIHLNTETYDKFLERYPDLTTRLANLIVDLSSQSGYRLNVEPQVRLIAANSIKPHQLMITAEHSEESRSKTAAMQPVDMTQSQSPIRHPRLLISDSESVELTQSLINIGREVDNDVVIDDAYISRHHLQLRKRFGVYTLFDINSSGGTRVNDTLVREHRLQNGDVIHIGHTTLIYTDESNVQSNADTTQTLDPV